MLDSNNPLNSLILFTALREMASNDQKRAHHHTPESPSLAARLITATRRFFISTVESDPTPEPAPVDISLSPNTTRSARGNRPIPSIPAQFALPKSSRTTAPAETTCCSADR